MRAASIAVVVALGTGTVGCGGHPPPTAEPGPEPAVIGTTPGVSAKAAPHGVVIGARLRSRLAHGGWLGALAWSPDGARLATGDDAGAVRVWDAGRGQPVLELERQASRISALAYAADGGRLAVAALTDLRVWDAASGALERALPGHGDIITDLRFDGELLLAVDLRDELRAWDLRDGRGATTLAVPTLHKLSVTMDPTGRTLALGGYGDIELIELPSRARRFKLEMPRCGEGGTAAAELLCVRWRTTRIEEFGAGPGDPPSTHEERRPNWYVEDLAYSADGSRLAAGRADGAAVVIDLRAGQPIARFAAGLDHGAAVALSPEGATLAVANRDGLIALWDVASQQETRLLHEPGRVTAALVFAPDGAALAAGGPGHDVTIWDLERAAAR